MFLRRAAASAFGARQLDGSIQAGGLSRIGTTTTSQSWSRSLASRGLLRRGLRKHVVERLGRPHQQPSHVHQAAPLVTYYILTFAICGGVGHPSLATRSPPRYLSFSIDLASPPPSLPSSPLFSLLSFFHHRVRHVVSRLVDFLVRFWQRR